MKYFSKVYFRADGNNQIGLGHIYRSLALASFIQDSYNCAFIIYKPAKAIREIILHQNISLIELQSCDYDNEELSSEIKNLIRNDDVIVLDGYKFTDSYQRALKNLGCGIVYIDDLIDNYLYADAVINHAGGISCSDYIRRKHTKLFLGPKYALIKKDFLLSRTRETVRTQFDKLLICLGGADPNNFTLQILNKLAALNHSFLEIHVVIGASFLHTESLQAIAGVRNEIKIHVNLDSPAMSKLMRECGIAITSASTVAYEYCCAGGLLFLIQTADNQKQLFNFLISQKFAQLFDQFPTLIKSQDLNEIYCCQAKVRKEVFDGLAPERLKNIIDDIALSKHINFRFADKNDMDIYFEWANDPVVRSHAYNTEQIKIENHRKWFEAKLSSQDTMMYIFQIADKNLGQVRFDILSDKTAIIDYSIDKKFRGEGYGAQMLQMAMRSFKGCHSIPLVAHVKSDNFPSRKIFERMDFRIAKEEQHNNSLFITYRKEE